jgi:hypothetical protein
MVAMATEIQRRLCVDTGITKSVEYTLMRAGCSYRRTRLVQKSSFPD